MNFVTAKELAAMKKKPIEDKLEALAMIRIAHTRFGFTTAYLDFKNVEAATEAFDFLQPLGYKVKYCDERDLEKVKKATKTLRVRW